MPIFPDYRKLIRQYRGGQKIDTFRFYITTTLYRNVMLLRWILVGVLLVLLLIQIGRI